MRSILTFVIASAALIGAAYAHPATEQYIPIGQSPGGGTVQGRAGAVAEPSTAAGAPTVTVETAAAPQSFVIGSRTRVYVDRSAQGLPSTVGTLADVQPGRIIEVRIADPQSRYAEWIKVRPE
jgi:hypothetical protein